MEDQLVSHDKEMITSYLVAITAPWINHPSDKWLELRCFAESRTPNVARFRPSDLSLAVAHAEAMNAQGLNVYACVNPIEPRHGLSSKAASDKDIRQAHFVFADCDEPGIAEQIPKIAPLYDFRLITGTVPYLRCHYYWQLEQPLNDLVEWQTLQKKLALGYGTDPAVCNPSRLMRVGGTISYPDQRKRERGYIKELTRMEQG